MHRVKIIGFILVFLLLIFLGAFGYRKLMPPTVVSNFIECQRAGFPIQESYPARCVTPGGQSFTEDIGNVVEKSNLINIDTPRPNQVVASPLIISGQARGTWYFEASFPVKLLDADGRVLAVGPAQAQGEWMTEQFVPFELTLVFNKPETKTGTLILEKDNPSGLPTNADELRIPVVFTE